MAATSTDTLVGSLVRMLETGEDREGVLHPEVFVDLNVPHWRYQLQGSKRLIEQLRSDSPNGALVTKGRFASTPGGFVLEARYVQNDHVGPDTMYRTLWLVEVEEGRITELVLYCTGEWDAKTQARHAAEAPMIRP